MSQTLIDYIIDLDQISRQIADLIASIGDADVDFLKDAKQEVCQAYYHMQQAKKSFIKRKRRRIVFVVDVEVLRDNDEFETVAVGLELHEPVYYKDEVMREAVETDPQMFKEELEGKSWNLILKEWRGKPI